VSRRRLAAAACGAAFLAGACSPAQTKPKSPPSFAQGIRAVSRSFIEETLSRKMTSGLSLRVYNTGSIRTRGKAVSSMKSWSAKVKLDVPVFLVKHPTEGFGLFDAGLSSETAHILNGGVLTGLIVSFRSEPGQDAASQLAGDGVPPAEVKWILLSHLHADHAARLDAFPNATVMVSRREWEGQKAKAAADKDPKLFDPAVWEGRLKLRLLDLESQPPFGAFDHALDLFADGSVFAVALPGHTPGSMGAWVNLDGGPVLMAGDAAWVVDNYMDLAMPHPRGMQDPVAYAHSIQILRAMQDAMPLLVIFPGHDLTPRTLTRRDDLPLVPFKGPVLK